MYYTTVCYKILYISANITSNFLCITKEKPQNGFSLYFEYRSASSATCAAAEAAATAGTSAAKSSASPTAEATAPGVRTGSVVMHMMVVMVMPS